MKRLRVRRLSHRNIDKLRAELVDTGSTIINDFLHRDTYKELMKLAKDAKYKTPPTIGMPTNAYMPNIPDYVYTHITAIVKQIVNVDAAFLYNDVQHDYILYNMFLKYTPENNLLNYHIDPNNSKGELIPGVLTLDSNPEFVFEYSYKDVYYKRNLPENSFLIHSPSILHCVRSEKPVLFRTSFLIFYTTVNEYHTNWLDAASNFYMSKIFVLQYLLKFDAYKQLYNIVKQT